MQQSKNDEHLINSIIQQGCMILKACSRPAPAHLTRLKAARGAKFDRTAQLTPHVRSVLPFSSSDTLEGSAHRNNPEKRARKARRKKSDMFPESAGFPWLVLVRVRVQSPPLHRHPVVECGSSVMSGGTSAQKKCGSRPHRLPDTCTHRCSPQRTGAPETAGEMRGRGRGRGWGGGGTGGVGGAGGWRRFPVFSQRFNAGRVTQLV